MDLLFNHIKPYLFSFLNETSPNFDKYIGKIDIIEKPDFHQFIKYFDKILNETFFANSDSLDALHIHIEDEFDDNLKLIISQYLLISTFRKFELISNTSTGLNSNLNELISTLEAKKKSLEMQCPDGASGKNGGNKVWKKWIENIKDVKTLLHFYKEIHKTINFKTIFNTQKNFSKLICNVFDNNPFAIMLSSNFLSYNLINTVDSLNDIDCKDNHIIDNIEYITLFDCEQKSLMTSFSFEEIKKWNNDHGTHFKKYLIVTFGNKPYSIHNIQNKLESISGRFKIPNSATYTILSTESDLLLNKSHNYTVPIIFIGTDKSIFWDSFLLETNIRDLYELRSIKLMNIYSICLTYELKDYVLSEIFSNNESSELLSTATKMAILELRDEDINLLKNLLSNILDIIINSSAKSSIVEKLSLTSTIIVDELILKNLKLLGYFNNFLIHLKKSNGIKSTPKIESWSYLLSDNPNSFLILSYRDQGKFPNYFYPNILEFSIQDRINCNIILQNFLFKNNYDWSRYNILKDYYKQLTHPIREIYFNWNEVKIILQEIKPESKLNIDWFWENEFSNTESRDTFKIKLYNQKPKSFHSSALLIFTEKNQYKPKIERAKWLFDNLDFDDSSYKIQNLDELLDEFNPAEKLIDTTQQEIELEIIRQQLGLGNISAGAIWKTLLRNKTVEFGIESIYAELKSIFDLNKISLVSEHHFRNSWINIDSQSLMPRGNWIFKCLCDFLGLNNNYRLILYRLKNNSISGKIEATKKYSNLLKDLFKDGCFDENIVLQTILEPKIQYYRNNHSLDELGIDEENPISGLVTLIELIQPELRLIDLESIEKIEQ